MLFCSYYIVRGYIANDRMPAAAAFLLTLARVQTPLLIKTIPTKSKQTPSIRNASKRSEYMYCIRISCDCKEENVNILPVRLRELHKLVGIYVYSDVISIDILYNAGGKNPV